MSDTDAIPLVQGTITQREFDLWVQEFCRQHNFEMREMVGERWGTDYEIAFVGRKEILPSLYADIKGSIFVNRNTPCIAVYIASLSVLGNECFDDAIFGWDTLHDGTWKWTNP